MHPTVQMQTAEGVPIDIEVKADQIPAGMTLAASPDGIKRIISAQTLEEALDRIKPVANALFQRLNGIDVTPDEVSVKFGVKLSVSAGVIISSTAADANFEFSLKWNPTKKKPEVQPDKEDVTAKMTR